MDRVAPSARLEEQIAELLKVNYGDHLSMAAA